MTKLEKLTYVFLIALCAVSLSVLVRNAFLRDAAAPAEDSVVGKSEAALPPVVWQGADRSVVMLLSSQCHFCLESMPFYHKLSDTCRGNSTKRPILVVGKESPEKLRGYLNENSLAVDKVLLAPDGFAGVQLTPAVFVVDSHGVITKAFFGKLSWLREQELLHTLK